MARCTNREYRGAKVVSLKWIIYFFSRPECGKVMLANNVSWRLGFFSGPACTSDEITNGYTLFENNEHFIFAHCEDNLYNPKQARNENTGMTAFFPSARFCQRLVKEEEEAR